MHKKPYKLVAMGGTFDHFHIGHQHFIDFAADLSEKMVIGLTTLQLTKSKTFAHTIESFTIRKRSIIKYCKKMGYQCQVVELNDIYGPTISDPEIQAVCVTQETQLGAKKINQTRDKLHMRPLPVHVCQMLTNDYGDIICSSLIRSGAIDRQGQRYISVYENGVILNQKQRDFFAQAQGDIVDYPSSNQPRFVVGDTSLKEFLEKGWQFDIGVFDGKEKRIPTPSKVVEESKIEMVFKNPSGEITAVMVKMLQKAIAEKKKFIFVDGEEDLAVLPLVLLAPLGSSVFYGQPEEGLVEIQISEEAKDRFFRQFKK